MASPGRLGRNVALLAVCGALLAAVCAEAPTSAPADAAVSPAPTPEPTKSSTSKGVGFLCAGVSIFFFGTNFVPVKKFESGDGFFFQFIMCCGVFTVGHVINAIRGYPRFEPIAMLGGMLWALGNLMTVPIIKTIGLAMGMLIWGAVNMIVGWGTGTFGWFDLAAAKREIGTPWLNYLGLVLALLSLVMYLWIEPTVKRIDQDQLLADQDTADVCEKLAVNTSWASPPDELTDANLASHTRGGGSEKSESLKSESDKSQTGLMTQAVLEETYIARSQPEGSALDRMPKTARRLSGVGALTGPTGELGAGGDGRAGWGAVWRLV